MPSQDGPAHGEHPPAVARSSKAPVARTATMKPIDPQTRMRL